MPVPEASWWLVERSAECDGGVPGSRQPASELDVIRNFGKKNFKLMLFVPLHVLFSFVSFILLFPRLSGKRLVF